jgi:hypothetical protein
LYIVASRNLSEIVEPSQVIENIEGRGRIKGVNSASGEIQNLFDMVI